MFLAGLSTTIGFQRTVKFFIKKKSNYKGTISFFLGFLLLLYGWPLIGMILEFYGFFMLFADFIPTAIVFMRRIPFLSTLLNMPGVKNVLNRVAPGGGANLPV